MVIAETRGGGGGRAPSGWGGATSRCPRSPPRPTRRRPDAPVLWDEHGSNVCVDSVAGDARAADAAFARAAHVVRLDTWVQRVTGVPMEPRAAVGVLRRGDAGATRSTPARAAWCARRTTSRWCSACRRRTCAWWRDDVGGNFGTREQLLSRVRAGRVGGAARWAGRSSGRATRREAFLTDYQGRDLVVRRRSWRSTRTATSSRCAASNTSNVGAHTVTFVAAQQGRARSSTSIYRMPAAAVPGARRAHQHHRRPAPIAARAGPR